MLNTPSPSPDILQLTSLPARHTHGQGFLEGYAAYIIARLSVDPTLLPSGTMCREIEVVWVPRGSGDVQNIRLTIGWAGNTYCTPQGCSELPDIHPETELTGTAAVGIFALLISELEKGRITKLAPLGSGADYWIEIEGENQPILAEVSGIRCGTDSEFGIRVREKTEQLFTKEDTRVGFVSVTNFLTTADKVHTCLTFANRRQQNRTRRKPPKKLTKKPRKR